ncbi:MAG: hypothetical protein H7199_01125 [Burkholderiales bacterium]|nr:hypothetical protein [Flavobacterium sp.]
MVVLGLFFLQGRNGLLSEIETSESPALNYVQYFPALWFCIGWVSKVIEATAKSSHYLTISTSNN